MKYKPGQIREDNVQKILAAGEKVFASQGFKGASMQQIADLAGIPKANLHYYFKTKDSLYLELLSRMQSLWNSALDDFTPSDDPAEVLSRWIEVKVEMGYQHPLSSKMFAMEVIQGAPHLRRHIREVTRPWFEQRIATIQQWIDHGRIAVVDPAHLIFLIWSSTQHYADYATQILTLTDQRRYRRKDIEHIKGSLIRMILAGCGLNIPERWQTVLSSQPDFLEVSPVQIELQGGNQRLA